MPYDPMMVKPMREEMTAMGAQELTTADAVESFLAKQDGTAVLFFNSVCGCAAGSARPGLARSLDHQRSPDRLATIFAGQDVEAAAHARERFPQYLPSSPSIVFLKDGQAVGYVHRSEIEGRDPASVAAALTGAYDQLCT